MAVGEMVGKRASARALKGTVWSEGTGDEGQGGNISRTIEQQASWSGLGRTNIVIVIDGRGLELVWVRWGRHA